MRAGDQKLRFDLVWPKGRQEIDTLVTCMNSVVTTIKTLKPAENFSEMRVYTIWAYMATLGGVT